VDERQFGENLDVSLMRSAWVRLWFISMPGATWHQTGYQLQAMPYRPTSTSAVVDGMKAKSLTGAQSQSLSRRLAPHPGTDGT